MRWEDKDHGMILPSSFIFSLSFFLSSHTHAYTPAFCPALVRFK